MRVSEFGGSSSFFFGEVRRTDCALSTVADGSCVPFTAVATAPPNEAVMAVRLSQGTAARLCEHICPARDSSNSLLSAHGGIRRPPTREQQQEQE